jgi:hypothetical protein
MTKKQMTKIMIAATMTSVSNGGSFIAHSRHQKKALLKKTYYSNQTDVRVVTCVAIVLNLK